MSKTIDAPYAPENRGLWRKSKCLNRQEFVVVGWTDPEGSRPYLGALLLGYYTDDGKLIYAGRVGTGMPAKVLADLRRRLEPFVRTGSPLSAPPPRKTRFGSPLVLSQIHWVEPQSGRRDHLSHLDRRPAPATNGLRRAPIRQAADAGAEGSGARPRLCRNCWRTRDICGSIAASRKVHPSSRSETTTPGRECWRPRALRPPVAGD